MPKRLQKGDNCTPCFDRFYYFHSESQSILQGNFARTVVCLGLRNCVMRIEL